MNKPVIVCVMLLVLAFSSAAALAQDIDFDDITMTVVGEGMFEARQLPRPSSDAIREFMDANRGDAPPDTQSVREAIEPDDRDPVSNLRSQHPSPRDQRNERPTRPQRPGNRG